MTRARSAPGRGGYVAAGIVLLLGVVAFGTILYLGLTGLSMERLVVPGSAEMPSAGRPFSAASGARRTTAQAGS